MYASTWICTKVSADPTAGLEDCVDANDHDGPGMDLEVVETLEL